MLGLLEALLALIFPERPACFLCNCDLEQPGICPACRQWLARFRQEQTCPCCGKPIAAFGSGAVPTLPGSQCQDCAGGGRAFDLARAVGPYEGPVRDAVKRFKFYKKQSLAEPLGRLMAEVALAHEPYRRARLLVPVPLSARRLRERGFNQARLLAEAAGRCLNLPVAEALVKIKDTPTQTALDRRGREQNLQTAFQVVNPELIRDCSIILVDDVSTTF